MTEATATRNQGERAAISRLFTREKRCASAEVRIGAECWAIELDGPNLGPMVLIYRCGAGVGWHLWGTAVWLNEKLEHHTAQRIDVEATLALEGALRAKLAQGAPS